jgi:hypothetical protein
MPKISTDKAVKGAIAIKQLSEIIKETENEGLIKAYAALHERMKRYGFLGFLYDCLRRASPFGLAR